jgi:hypothetical protein
MIFIKFADSFLRLIFGLMGCGCLLGFVWFPSSPMYGASAALGYFIAAYFSINSQWWMGGIAFGLVVVSFIFKIVHEGTLLLPIDLCIESLIALLPLIFRGFTIFKLRSFKVRLPHKNLP